jgi:hypothetical protein
MTVEDRLRAATRARAELVREIRPLEIPERRPSRAPRTSRSRRLRNWLTPLAAAAVVAALTIALVTVRQLRNDGGTPRPTTVSPVAGTTIPRYYVTLNDTSGAFQNPMPGQATRPVPLVIGDSRTGSALETVAPPRGQTFVGVTGAADDRTFVVAAATFPLTSDTVSPNPVAWYQLRIAPGTAKLAGSTITRLSIPGQPAGTLVSGIALSPDGSKLAVYFQQPGGGTVGRQHLLVLRIYATGTGRVLRTWTHDTHGNAAGYGWYYGRYSNTSLTWLADGHSLAFEFGVNNGANGPPLAPVFAVPTVRTLNLASPAQDMVLGSKVVFRESATEVSPSLGCFTLQLTADGKTVLCGTYAGSSRGGTFTSGIIAFSVGTAKPRPLYQVRCNCELTLADVLWSSNDGSKLVVSTYTATDMRKPSTGREVMGELASGKLTSMKIPFRNAPYVGEVAF